MFCFWSDLNSRILRVRRVFLRFSSEVYFLHLPTDMRRGFSMSGYAKDSAGKNPRGFSSKASLWEDFILQYSTHLSGHRYHRWDVTGHDGACHGMPMLICRTSLCHEEKCELHMLHGVSRSSIERNMILIYKKDGNGQMNTNET